MEAVDVNTFSYRGSKYRDIINEIELKKACIEHLNICSIEFSREELTSIGTITGIAKYMIFEKKVPTNDFNTIMFQNLTYTCSNIFLDKITTKLTDENIENGFNSIINSINKDVVTNEQFELMNKSGFNLLDCVPTREDNKLLFPVLEYSSKEINLMCVVQYDSKGKRKFKVCSININRITNDITFYINGSVGSFVLSNYQKENISSSKSFFSVIKTFVSAFLKIHFVPREMKYQLEREKMFLFCKQLNHGMIKDYIEELDKEIRSMLAGQITRTIGRIRTINSNVKLDKKSKEDLYNKIFDAYLGQYVTNGYDETDLKQKALEKNMNCYPTNISFTGQELSKGKAKARKKEIPLVFEKVFYSLNTDIETAKRLEEVTMAWFDAPFFPKRKETDVSQTTITISKQYFLIVMKNGVYKNKGMTELVEKTIREVLS
ncbi:hypothetical protein [Enterococcus larvae]|uniref:hypothetical protein n=1 Tax=Enterococcus larvae TaxID=2794352 RepID=UPI003F3D4CE0